MIQRRLAADILKCSPRRIKFDENSLDEIKQAITKVDVRSLIKQGVIRREPITGQSNARLKTRKKQEAKGRRRGAGSRKGRATARMPGKDAWMSRIRTQRDLIFRLREREVISDETFRMLYRRTKGGFFRSERHLKLYCEEQNLFVKKDTK